MFHDLPRIILDTGVIVSNALLPGSVPHQAVLLAQQKMLPLISEATLDELALVLQRPKLTRYISQEKIERLLHDITQGSELVLITTTILACRDPKDNKFVELAISGDADMIVTGDSDLLTLNPFQNVAIMTPRDFIDKNK